MTRLVFGVDPGLYGGLVVYMAGDEPKDRRVIDAIKMPIRDSHREGKKEVDPVRLADWLCKYPQVETAYIEQVSGRPGQAGQFQFGVNFGVVVGIIASMCIDVVYVTPVKWKRAYNLSRNPGETDSQYKKRSIDMAQMIFPSLDCGNSDGVAEALLIAFYGAHHE